jgi:hypothetical protein
MTTSPSVPMSARPRSLYPCLWPSPAQCCPSAHRSYRCHCHWNRPCTTCVEPAREHRLLEQAGQRSKRHSSSRAELAGGDPGLPAGRRCCKTCALVGWVLTDGQYALHGSCSLQQQQQQQRAAVSSLPRSAVGGLFAHTVSQYSLWPHRAVAVGLHLCRWSGTAVAATAVCIRRGRERSHS